MSRFKKYSLFVAVFLASFTLTKLFYNPNPTDITKNAVMVVNKAMNHGGTGIIYESSSKGSYILTNKHVCDAIKNGGVVRTSNAQYQIQSFQESSVSDLCLAYVPANLKQQTKLASKEPNTFSPAKVSGHPALMPTVISTGHFSERSIIQVFTGMTQCTDSQQQDPNTALLCAFFGGLPIIKSYESVLVSATIMPGSSGSGVYNSSNELSGVVFAGQGEFAYGWTVPYDQVAAFLNNESQKGSFEKIDQTINMFDKGNDNKNLHEVLKKCVTATDIKILSVCAVLKRDVMWVK